MNKKCFFIVCYLIILKGYNCLALDNLNNLIPSESDQIINPSSIKELSKNQNFSLEKQNSKTEPTVKENSDKPIDNSLSINQIKKSSEQNIEKNELAKPIEADRSTKQIITQKNNESSNLKLSATDQPAVDIKSFNNIEHNSTDVIANKYKLSQINYSVMFSQNEIEAINKAINNSIITKNQQIDSILPNKSIDIVSITEKIVTKKPKTIPT